MPKRSLVLLVLLALALLLPSSTPITQAAAAPITLSVSLSADRPALGSDLVATVVVFGGAGDVDVAIELPTGVTGPAAATIHAAPVGLAVVRLHIAGNAAVGPRILRFRAAGQLVTKSIYLGTFPWPAAQVPVWRLWLPLITR